ncbi:NIPSNAP family protein [Musicola paradisiaca]|uniref:NIPSNAP family containing protein n=1 Tax=Musicola paradisiaca (strain Ech703) TaxID=579405 RepID=C6C5Q4_MUSP7|nr:NIPSNAP family protein [Musicola paradisiaca]ACS83867.1 NIPSNAP family containing protein [Musicola paradisiaca Ech703]
MRVFQLRTYTLKTPEAAAQYAEIWYAHITSLKAFHIQTHGVFQPLAHERQVIALVSYPENADVPALGAAYMSSDAFRADMAGFDIAMIEKVEETLLGALPASPLQ